MFFYLHITFSNFLNLYIAHFGHGYDWFALQYVRHETNFEIS